MSDFFEYPVLSDQEIEELRPILQPGIWDFEVISAEKKISKSGNSMIQLKLKVWGDQGKEFLIFDWLVGIASMAYKIKHFWASVGYPEKYDAGNAAVQDFLGMVGKVRTAMKKDNEGKIQSRVDDYVAHIATQIKTESDIPDDEVPF